MPVLTFYYRPTCPFCQKVNRYLEQHGIIIPMKDISANLNNREELVRIGGKQQVPCLVIDGKAVYESDDIVAWLRGHKL